VLFCQCARGPGFPPHSLAAAHSFVVGVGANMPPAYRRALATPRPADLRLSSLPTCSNPALISLAKKKEGIIFLLFSLLGDKDFRLIRSPSLAHSLSRVALSFPRKLSDRSLRRRSAERRLVRYNPVRILARSQTK